MISTTKLLQLFDNNEQLVEQYLVLVKQEIPKELAALEIFIKEGNLNDASIVAHGIKGQCDYLDLQDCVEMAFKIELMVNEKDLKKEVFLLFQELKKCLYKTLSI